MIDISFLNDIAASIGNVFTAGIDIGGIITSILGGLGGFGS